MSFHQMARGLLKETVPEVLTTKPSGRADIMARLDKAGFSVDEVFNDLRTLYDTTEEDSIKRGIASDILKVRGLMQSEQIRPEAPQIIINVAGDNTKVNMMLCPQLEAN